MVTEEGFLYTELNDRTLEIEQYIGNEKIIWVPYYHENALITSIGSKAFANCSFLKSIYLKKNITVIGADAFRGCKRLREIRLPSTLTKIGAGAFQGVPKDALKFSPNQTIFFIEGGILYERSSDGLIAKQVTGCFSGLFPIKEGTVTIERECFSYFIFLQSVILPAALRKIEERAFYSCYQLYCIDIPNSTYYIGDHAFRDCVSLISVKISENIKYIGSWAFANCKELFLINLPFGLETIGESAFYACESLAEVKIPGSVVNLEHDLFKSCFKLCNVYIPDSVKQIGTHAFAGCRNLVIHGVKNSYAENYANENGINFIAERNIKKG